MDLGVCLLIREYERMGADSCFRWHGLMLWLMSHRVQEILILERLLQKVRSPCLHGPDTQGNRDEPFDGSSYLLTISEIGTIIR